MAKMLRETCCRALVVLSMGLSGSAVAGDEVSKKAEDHDIALGALARQEVLPLETVLSQVRKTISGEIVGIELERNSGVWVYQIKVIAPGDNMIQAFVDARTAKVIETRGQ
ncbi:PepSY domain-containing protein [Methylocystis echinoides]|jgi:uncharacterized membrane protein YkoI|uniref:PepSY domain-containing protein n=1 Tax=Methylocystis echinoides TaxID=29468 RepID=UPI0024930935|nr:PepSY domain-containing protein [Methylocystis echinoides]